MFLEKINNPYDLKKIEIKDLNSVSNEVRDAVINRISKIGGHMGPNLGIVEATVALHYVFNSPIDKIVFDVSHQSYPHKILTGRKEAFICDDHMHDVTGFTNPLESVHDHFAIGHTSTSISLALGLAKGRDLAGSHENIIAVIGDGSLSGGEALEGLDFAGEYKNNLIIIVNDNNQSIAENHGGLYKSLKDLRDTNGKSDNNIFKAFGLDYRYLEDGNDAIKLVKFFMEYKDISHPIVLHIHTIKGKGLPYAEKDVEKWHQGAPFNVSDGSPLVKASNNIEALQKSLFDLLDSNDKAVVLNAGTPARLGFFKGLREKYVERGQFIDVGIAEESAIAMVSGIAKNGGVAVFGTLAAFLQRTYDQVSHDLCLNNNPGVFLTLLAGVHGLTSNTHIALCDIQMYSHIPNLVYLAPTSKEEYLQMFKYATTQKEHPIAIRVPYKMIENGIPDNTDYSFLNKSKVVFEGEDVAIIGVSNMLEMAIDVRNKLFKETGKKITVINPCYLTGLDNELLDKLLINHKLIITLEDGELFGGYGQNITSYYGMKDIKVKNFGISKEFHTNFIPDKLLEVNGMSVPLLIEFIENNI